MKLPILILPFLLTLVVAGCDLLGSDSSSAGLSVQPVSSVEAALTIRANSSSELSILRDGQVVAEFRLSGRDTVFIDNGLQPLGSYSWQVFIEGRPVGRKVSAAMPDTTSSNFTWQTFTFGGDVNSSLLYDIAIIDENNIWAVGEIFLRDETHVNGYQMYNAAHWDGTAWELKQVPYYYENQAFFNSIYSVFALSENDIWFVGNGVINWDGQEYNPKVLPQNAWGPYRINKIWGTSSKDIYIAGNNGSIAHYDGKAWRKLESGTRSHFMDLYGAKHPRTGRLEIMGVASEQDAVYGIAVVGIQGDKVEVINQQGLGGWIYTVWFVPGVKYIIGGSHLQVTYGTNQYWERDSNFHSARTESKTALRGNDLNDLILVGSFGMLMHFNGASWHSFDDQQITNGAYTSVAITGNRVAVTGYQGGVAVVLLGTRN